ncbi:MAG: hypothetical protein J5780_06310 [Treponema sp.]|nr:hypothetical protein [Treponema sp.]
MKTHEWFVCLDYGSTELLIPHSLVTDTFPSSQKNSGIKNHHIDTIIKPEGFPEENSRCSKLFIQSKTFFFITTSAKISIREICLKDFKFISGVLKESLKKRGVVAFSFKENTMQLIIDIDNFIEYGGHL